MFAEAMRPLMGQGMLLIDGEQWRIHHKIASPGMKG